MSEKSPAYQRYSKDYLSSVRVQMMSLAEEGAYNRLIEYCWLNGSIPSDPNKVVRLVGKGCSVEVAKVCMEMFSPHPADENLLIHDRLEIERDKQKSNSDARRKASAARWDKQGKSEKNGKSGTSADVRGKRDEADNTNGKQVKSKSDANAMQMDMQNASSSFASSTSNTVFPNGNNSREKVAGGLAVKNGNSNGTEKPKPADPPPRIAAGSEDESQDDYLIRKQLENPKLDVQACFKKYLAFCTKNRKQPKRRFFDEWLEKEDVPLEAQPETDDAPDWLKAIEGCSKCDEKGLTADRKVCNHEVKKL